MEQSVTKRHKVIVIGVDGASIDLIKLWKNDLPNFRMLIEQGAWGRMQSSWPPVTCPAWNCMFTGKNPAKIGMFTHWHLPVYRKNGPELIDYSSQDSPSIWELLSDAGLQVGVVGVPTSYPPRAVDGFVISDWMGVGFSTKVDYTYPAEFKRKLRALNYHTRSFIDLRIAGKDKTYTDRYRQYTSQQFDVVKKLISEEPWDFFTCIFTGTDGIQHYMWHHLDPAHPWHNENRARKFGSGIFDIYKEVDKGIGKLISVMPEDVTILVVSDHGAKSNKGQFLVNEWLKNEGLLVLNDEKPNGNILFGALTSAIEVVIRLFPQYIIEWSRQLIPLSWINRIYETITLRQSEKAFIDRIDWRKTKVYSVGMAGGIYINLKGRDTYGIVDPNEYDGLRNKIQNMLLELRGPAGETLENLVFKKEEVYSGKYLNLAPDLVFAIDNFNFVQMPTLSKGRVWLDPMNSGWHDQFGIFIAYGPDIKHGAEINGIGICDITPTILHIFGLPVDPDMDGKVLTTIYREDSAQGRRAVRYQNISHDKASLRRKIAQIKNRLVGKYRKL